MATTQDVSHAFNINVNGVLYKLDDILESQISEIKKQNITIKELKDDVAELTKNINNGKASGDQRRGPQPLTDLKGLQKLDKFSDPNKQCFRQ